MGQNQRSQNVALERALAITSSRRWDVNERQPLVFGRADGAYAWDVAGNRYLDLTSCSGAAPLGARHPEVRAAIHQATDELGGMVPGTVSEPRTAAASRLVETFPCAERATFFRTGSCATAAAVRIARAATGRRIVLTSGFHGWHDSYLQVRESALQGRDPETIDFGYSLARLEQILVDSRDQVAAVIVTPEVGYFPVPYYQRLEQIVRGAGTLMIYDEVMTGFRYAVGGFHAAIGGTPDLIAVSKGVANGTALSAVLGRESVMSAQEETYLGNTYLREVTPFVVAAATIPILTHGGIDDMNARGSELREGLNTIFAEHGVEARAFGPTAMFDVVFRDDEFGRKLYGDLLAEGILLDYGGTHLVSAVTSGAAVQDALAIADRMIGQQASGSTVPPERRGDIPFETLAQTAREAINADPEELANWW